MGVRIEYSCSGCGAFAAVAARVDREVLSSGHVIGGVVCDKVLTHRPSIEEAVPEGWVAFDPYTDCTYCPECWASIEAGDEAN